MTDDWPTVESVYTITIRNKGEERLVTASDLRYAVQQFVNNSDDPKGLIDIEVESH
jgi:hypothetical protein